MKLAELASRIAENSGITTSQAEKAIAALKETIAEELRDHEKFYLYGFGTFQLHTRKARRGRNPRTGRVMEIPAKRVIKWSSAKALDKKAGAGKVKAGAPAGKERAKGFVITEKGSDADVRSPIDMVPDIVSRGSAAAVEEPPSVSNIPTAIPSAGALDEERMLKRARSMAKVNVDDIFLYYSDALKEAVTSGQDPEEVVAEQLEQARKTLVRRLGEDIATREDFVGKAFKRKMDRFSPN